MHRIALMNSSVFRPSLVLIFSLALACQVQAKGKRNEVVLDAKTPPRVYSPDGAVCEVLRAEKGRGIRVNYDFTKSEADWLQISFKIPAIESPVKNMKITIRGTAPVTWLALRGGSENTATGFAFGPLEKDTPKTFEIDPRSPGEGSTSPNDGIIYPVGTVVISIKLKDIATPGFVEVSEIEIETE